MANGVNAYHKAKSLNISLNLNMNMLETIKQFSK